MAAAAADAGRDEVEGDALVAGADRRLEDAGAAQAFAARADLQFEAQVQVLGGEAEGRGAASGKREIENALLVGNDVVYLQRGADGNDKLQVGQIAFKIAEVRDYALRGANLPLTGGRLLQAAMGLLVVAAEERARAGEDVSLLSKRIADYEAWAGHTAGR